MSKKKVAKNLLLSTDAVKECIRCGDLVKINNDPTNTYNYANFLFKKKAFSVSVFSNQQEMNNKIKEVFNEALNDGYSGFCEDCFSKTIEEL